MTQQNYRERIHGIIQKKYDYVLMNNDVVGQKNYLDPVVDGNKVIFERRQARVKDGDKDMEEQAYKYELWDE